MSTIRSRTISGLKWSGASQIFAQVLKFVVSVLLARLLDPSSFGLLAMVTFFTGIAMLFADMGMGSALVQRKDLSERHTSTVFWTNLAAGIGLAVLFIISAPLIARFYSEPDLIPLVIASALLFPINGLAIVQRNLLVRATKFKSLFRVDVAASIVGGAVAIAAALSGWGVWALIVQQFVTSITSNTVLWITSAWRPKAQFDREALREIWGYGGNLMGFQLVNYGARNLDNLLIGRYLGPDALGLYSRAYSLMLLPISEITAVFSRVMFPILASVQNEKETVKRLYLRAIRSIALVSFPLMAGLIVVAEPFVLTLFGESWRPMIPLLQILSFGGMFQSVASAVGWIFTSQGRTDVFFRWGIVALGVVFLAFIVGLQWGLIGVAACYVFSSVVLLMVPSWYISGKLINLSVAETVQNLAPILLCALLMAGVVWIVGYAVPDTWPPVLLLAVQVSVGFLVYWGILYFSRLKAFRELSTTLQAELRVPQSLKFLFRTRTNGESVAK